VLRAVAAERKVALVIGGGSGHYPAFAGMSAGASPTRRSRETSSPRLRQAASPRLARLAHHGAGILLGFGNYARNVLNFGKAARRLVSEGIDVRILAVTDDVASAPAETPSLRWGVAGDVAVFKAAGNSGRGRARL
jgi:D-erythrulose 4-kinase